MLGRTERRGNYPGGNCSWCRSAEHWRDFQPKRLAMPQTTSPFLRRVLLMDAVSSGLMGILMLVAADPLEKWLGLLATLLKIAGLSLLPFAALVAWLALRRSLSRGGVWAVIVVNALWAADSMLLRFSDRVSPALLGYAFVIVQAAIVAPLAELEYVGLRRAAAIV